jgi:hypothetical protein
MAEDCLRLKKQLNTIAFIAVEGPEECNSRIHEGMSFMKEKQGRE